MTSVVGILNKQAVAIAADSAVTINGVSNRKIYNRALKIFTLSKHHPVGVMIYNSAFFMGTPWETIIKVYRKELGNTSFPTLRAYQENFIQFLHNKNFYCDESHQKTYLGGLLNSLLQLFYNSSINNPTPPLPLDEVMKKARILELIETEADKWLIQLNSNPTVFPEFINYTIADFWLFFEQTFDVLMENNYTQHGYVPSHGFKEKLKDLFYLIVIKLENQTPHTGLVFVGFGEDEIFPQLITLNISLGLQTRLRYYVDEGMTVKINDENSGAIRPFAQTDVINTILSGIDPHLEKTYNENVEKTFSKYNQLLLTTIGTTNPVLTAQINAIDVGGLVNEFKVMNNATKQLNYINPLMQAVSILSKEDLAEMAESLIYLTYLKRRFSNSEESVGGPVDVAIISKGDGFVWIKRKHYFSPELNQHFFDKYLNT